MNLRLSCEFSKKYTIIFARHCGNRFFDNFKIHYNVVRLDNNVPDACRILNYFSYLF